MESDEICYAVRLKGPTAEVPMEEVQRMFDTNVFGAMRAARAVIPHMAAQKSGVIVNMGSIVGGLYVSHSYHLSFNYSSLTFSVCYVDDLMALTGQRLGTGTIALPKPPCTRSPKCSRWNARHSTFPSSCSPQG